MKFRNSILFVGAVLSIAVTISLVTGVPEAIPPALNAVLVLALPLLVGVYLTNKFKLSWRLWWIGAATFTLSQVLHIPYNIYALEPMIGALGWELQPGTLQLFLVLLLYGLSAGVFEEVARYLMFRFWTKDERSWKEGVLIGAGHGGIEAVFVGLMVAATLYQMIAVQGANLADLVPAEEIASVQEYVDLYWSTPAWSHFLSLIERSLTMIIHVSFSLLVMQSFIRKNIGWLAASILYHTMVNAVALFAAQSYGVVYSEITLFFFALLSVYIIYRFWKQEPEEVQEKVQPVEMLELSSSEILNRDTIEKSKYD